MITAIDTNVLLDTVAGILSARARQTFARKSFQPHSGKAHCSTQLYSTPTLRREARSVECTYGLRRR